MAIARPVRVEQVDLLVVGSGGGGLTSAVVARKAGLKVLLIEKDDLFGGTTAYSGGMIWIPCNQHAQAANARSGKDDSIALARRYILDEGRGRVDPAKVEAYLEQGPAMVAYMERETQVRFYSMDYPDYVSENPASRTQRGLCTVNYKTSEMGEQLKHLRNQLPQTLFLGLAIGSSVEMKEFMRAGRSIRSMGFVLRKLLAHARDMVVYGRSEQMVRGRALVGRLLRTATDLDIPLWRKSPMRSLIREGGRVVGALVDTSEGLVEVRTARGVVLACGGYGRDAERRAATYPATANGANHPTPVPIGNTGDGVRAAEQIGGRFDAGVHQVSPWMPVSQIPGVQGVEGVWPHLVDRMKPGFIAVSRKGRRFADESSSYHHFIPGMIRASQEEGEAEATAWIVADARAVNHWGMGFVRPFPIPKGRYLRNGYLLRGDTLAELAARAGIDAAGLQATVEEFNRNALAGVDPHFNRGNRTYDSYQGDEDIQPNSCLAPLVQGPFYAVRLHVGEIGTFAGLKTDAHARVVGSDDAPIPGLYAVGNDQVSVFGGAYPGPGSTIGPAMTFGYIAARHAAGQMPSTAPARRVEPEPAHA